jgi:hypothetical protein
MTPPAGAAMAPIQPIAPVAPIAPVTPFVSPPRGPFVVPPPMPPRAGRWRDDNRREYGGRGGRGRGSGATNLRYPARH